MPCTQNPLSSLNLPGIPSLCLSRSLPRPSVTLYLPLSRAPLSRTKYVHPMRIRHVAWACTYGSGENCPRLLYSDALETGETRYSALMLYTCIHTRSERGTDRDCDTHTLVLSRIRTHVFSIITPLFSSLSLRAFLYNSARDFLMSPTFTHILYLYMWRCSLSSLYIIQCVRLNVRQGE